MCALSCPVPLMWWGSGIKCSAPGAPHSKHLQTVVSRSFLKLPHLQSSNYCGWFLTSHWEISWASWNSTIQTVSEKCHEHCKALWSGGSSYYDLARLCLSVLQVLQTSSDIMPLQKLSTTQASTMVQEVAKIESWRVQKNVVPNYGP